MDYETWLGIFKNLDTDGSENIIEQLKQNLLNIDSSLYEKWEKNNFDVNFTFKIEEKNTTILQMAVKNKFENLIGPLSDLCDLTTVDASGNTILHLAVENNLLGFAKHLIIDKNVNEKSVNNDRQTVLHLAANIKLDVCKFPFIKFLVEEFKLDVNAEDKFGRNVLHQAVKTDHLEVIKYLIEEKGMDCSKTDLRGRTPCLFAAKSGAINTLKYLVEDLKADCLKADNLKVTPLHKAAENGHFNVVKYLVENDADILARDVDGLIPLHLASNRGFLDIVKYFIEEKEVFVDTKDNNNSTALHDAILSGHYEIYQYLIDKNADVQVVTSNGFTSVHYAAGYNRLNILKDLIEEKKLDFQIPDEDSCTPLQFAAVIGSFSTFEYLIGMFSDFNVINKNNKIVNYSCQGGSLDIIKYLIEDLKVDVNLFNVFDEDGASPLALAISTDNYDVVKYLLQKLGFVSVNIDKLNPLELAAKKSDLKMLQVILESSDVTVDIISKALTYCKCDDNDFGGIAENLEKVNYLKSKLLVVKN